MLSFVKVHGFHEVSMSLGTLGSLAMFILVCMVNAAVTDKPYGAAILPVGLALVALFATFFFLGLYFLQHVRKERLHLIRMLKQEGLNKDLELLGLAGRSDVVLILPGIGLPFGDNDDGKHNR